MILFWHMAGEIMSPGLSPLASHGEIWIWKDQLHDENFLFSVWNETLDAAKILLCEKASIEQENTSLNSASNRQGVVRSKARAITGFRRPGDQTQARTWGSDLEMLGPRNVIGFRPAAAPGKFPPCAMIWSQNSNLYRARKYEGMNHCQGRGNVNKGTWANISPANSLHILLLLCSFLTAASVILPSCKPWDPLEAYQWLFN